MKFCTSCPAQSCSMCSLDITICNKLSTSSSLERLHILVLINPPFLLQSLEMLQLGNNALKGINGSWFQGMRNLLTLQLEGNLITKLPAGTFKSASLDKLESLDLSDNLIDFLAKGSFHGLPQLRRLDLSRNRLRSTPDAFSYLTWLSALNLDYNQWNCTCESYPKTFIWLTHTSRKPISKLFQYELNRQSR
uniref:LRRCT domain-containing protein n=1 Tax=Paramormyrops kingsleyae TaxID=1676925 RepID=A0A3B3SBU9_9TELE